MIQEDLDALALGRSWRQHLEHVRESLGSSEKYHTRGATHRVDPERKGSPNLRENKEEHACLSGETSLGAQGFSRRSRGVEGVRRQGLVVGSFAAVSAYAAATPSC